MTCERNTEIVYLDEYFEENQACTLNINVDPKRRGLIDLEEMESMSLRIKNIETDEVVEVEGEAESATVMQCYIESGILKEGNYKISPKCVDENGNDFYPGKPVYVKVVKF